MKHLKTGLTRGALASFVVFAAISAAHAGMLASDAPAQNGTMLVSKSVLVDGSQPTVTMISVPVPGEVSFTTTDLDFPQALEQLQLDIVGTSGPMASLSGPGTLTLDVPKPETLYAEVFPMAQDGPDFGLYNLTVRLGAGPVPLPASGSLLGGALLLGLAMFQRPSMRRRQLS